MKDLQNFYDDVARVAYDLFEKRGKVHGYDMEDWFNAEMIVKKRFEKEADCEVEAVKPPKRTNASEKTKPKNPK